MAFRVTSPPSSWAINFLNEVTISGPNSSSFHLLAYCAMKRMSLDLVTMPHQQTHTCFHSIGRKQKEKLTSFDFGENVYSSKFLQWVQFSSVQSLSRVRLFATPWITAHQASLPITNSQSSSKLMSIELVIPSSHLILCHPLLLLPPKIPPSIRVFSFYLQRVNIT